MPTIGKKCPMGHTELCGADCAWNENDTCAVYTIAKALSKSKSKRVYRKPTTTKGQK